MYYKKLIDELLQELSYRSNEGYPILSKKEHQSIISEILTEWGEFGAKEIIMEFLTEGPKVQEADETGYTHIGAGVYVRSGDVGPDGKAKAGAQKYSQDESGRFSPISEDDYEAIKSTQGAEGEDAAAAQNAQTAAQAGGDAGAEGETGGEVVQEPQPGSSLKDPSYQDLVKREKEVQKQIAAEKEKSTPKTTSNPQPVTKPKKEKPPKNKKLNQVDSVNEFNTNSKFAGDGVSDDDFNKNPNIVKTTKQVEFTEQELDEILGKPRKFPKKYEKVLLRLLNTKNSKDISITDFTNAAGGGTLSSTAGEILTTIGLSIKDDEMAKRFFDKIEAHVKATKNESIFDAGWVKSARQVRQATKRRYDRMFGKGNWELETMAWDIPEEVEALGLNDYKNNKGFSTDTYAKVKVNGESILDEISLKKSKTANLLNTTTNRVDDIFFRGSATEEELDEMESLETEYNTISSKQDKASKNRKLEIIARIKQLHNKYNKNVPEDAKVEVTKKKQTNIHKKGLEKNGQNLREANKQYSSLSIEEKDKAFRELELMMGQNFSPKQRQQFEDIFAQITPPLNYEQLKQLNSAIGLGTDARKVQKTSVMLHAMAKILGNPAGETYDELVQNAHKHASEVSKAVLSDKNAKAGLLSSIQEDFPLKALMSGEENMTLGDLSADKQTLARVFGIDDFEKLQENLNVRETPPPASIVYSIEGQEDIPVAEISTRPDGIGYGSVWKLEMKVHPEFAKRIETAQKELEG